MLPSPLTFSTQNK